MDERKKKDGQRKEKKLQAMHEGERERKTHKEQTVKNDPHQMNPAVANRPGGKDNG